MPDNQEIKDAIRLQQCRRIVEALRDQFGEPMLLDALALVCETPDGLRYLTAAAAFSREMKQGPTLSPGPDIEFQI